MSAGEAEVPDDLRGKMLHLLARTNCMTVSPAARPSSATFRFSLKLLSLAKAHTLSARFASS